MFLPNSSQQNIWFQSWNVRGAAFCKYEILTQFNVILSCLINTI